MTTPVFPRVSQGLTRIAITFRTWDRSTNSPHQLRPSATPWRSIPRKPRSAFTPRVDMHLLTCFCMPCSWPETAPRRQESSQPCERLIALTRPVWSHKTSATRRPVPPMETRSPASTSTRSRPAPLLRSQALRFVVRSERVAWPAATPAISTPARVGESVLVARQRLADRRVGSE